jgi:mRNA interferase RelE/StbE
VEIDDRAAREIRKLDGVEAQRRILGFLRQRIATREDPRRLGHALTGARTGLWRYRIGPYRLISRIEDSRVVVLVLRVGHRSEIYR